VTATATKRRSARLCAAVDLHCHILPGLDDGARDLDDALAMVRAAQADGIAAICSTPHIRHDHDVRIGELPARRAELEAAVAQAGCNTRILPGGEVAVSAAAGLDDHELAAVSLGGSGRWILLEPSPGPLGDALDAVAEELAARSFRALIAHPERHPAPDLVQRLQRLIARGALVQATAAFLTDETAQPGMTALAREGVLHVLGSDSHSSRAGRPVALTPALDVLRSVQPTAAHLDWIARAGPMAIVRGEDVRAPF
jgi:protein-tyrosine phosphatase